MLQHFKIGSMALVMTLAFGTSQVQAQVTAPYLQVQPPYTQVQAPYNVFNPYVTSPGGAGYNPYLPSTGGTGSPGYGSDYLLNPYSPYSPYGSMGQGWDPWGTRGWADLMRARSLQLLTEGQVSTQWEQARLMRQQYEQARIETARKRFEFEMFKKANTPTFTQEQEKIAKQTLRRIQTNSSPAEISSGKALNVLLDDVRKMPGKKVSMDPIPMSEDMLKNINVVKEFGNLGLLRDEGKFVWPVAFSSILTPEEQTKIEMNTQALVQKAFKGQLDNNLLREVRNLVDAVGKKLSQKVNDLPTSEYLQAKRFLNEFDEARLALENQEAPTFAKYQKFIGGGKTVQELVDYLVANGLKLAPATSRDEAAYRALYSGLVAFDVALNAQVGVPESKE